MNTKTDIEKLAGIVAKEASKDDVPLVEKVEALKELVRFFDVLCKQKGSDNLDTPAPNGASFDKFRKDVAPPLPAIGGSTGDGKAPNGSSAKVRHRSG